jgi:hypothetical protein
MPRRMMLGDPYLITFVKLKMSFTNVPDAIKFFGLAAIPDGRWKELSVCLNKK